MAAADPATRQLALRGVFDDLVRLETNLWNGIDARLQRDIRVTLAAFNALLVISSTTACRVFDLAQAVSITVGGASQAVDRLESQGLCVRRTNPLDRRSSIVELTPRGRVALTRAEPIFDRELATWLGGTLDGATFAVFSEALAKLRSAGRGRRTVGDDAMCFPQMGD